MSSSERKIWQPVPPEFVDRLDPAYVSFHNATIAYAYPLELVSSWNLAVRNNNINIPSTLPAVEGDAPEGGWPVLIYFHGGGWVPGNIDSENSLCSVFCKRARCVVVTVDYRLAPENPYPIAVDDAVEVLKWVRENAQVQLGANPHRIGISGSSSGGNLATVLALHAVQFEPSIPLTFQLLIVPVLDNVPNSKFVYKSHAENANTVGLPLRRVEWFRDQYLPPDIDRSIWQISPMHAPKELLAKLPKTWIGVSELDVLRDEGIAYGDRLREAGVDAEVKAYERVTHGLTALTGVMLPTSMQAVNDAAEALAKAFDD